MPQESATADLATPELTAPIPIDVLTPERVRHTVSLDTPIPAGIGNGAFAMKIERYLSQADATVLSRLAEQLLRVREVKFNAGEELIDLLSTAILLPENSTRTDCVALHTEVTYHTGSSKEKKTLAIVCPQDANQELARVSVLAPLAMALIGREVGSVIDVRLPFSQSQTVSILEVQPISAPASYQ